MLVSSYNVLTSSQGGKEYSKMKTTILKFLGIALAAVVILPVAHAQMGQQQGMGQSSGMGQSQAQQGQQAAPPAQAPAAAPMDPAEDAACKKAMAKSTDTKQVAADSNEYLKKYPSGRCAGKVYAQLAMAYFIEGEGDKAGAAAQKALQINANDPDALPVMAIFTAHQISGGPGSAPKIKQTEDFANQGIQLLNGLTKPSPDITDADFATQRDAKLSMCHSALGLAYLFEGKGALAVQHLSMATKLTTPPDSMDMYLLAVAYDSTGQFGQAVTTFEAACPKLTGEMQQRCVGLLAEEKKKAPK
jgi:Flp pilus assembly protein TadD